jgi:hypothetical protein
MKTLLTIALVAGFTAATASAGPSRFHKRIVASAKQSDSLPAVAAGPEAGKSKACDKCKASKQEKR